MKKEEVVFEFADGTFEVPRTLKKGEKVGGYHFMESTPRESWTEDIYTAEGGEMLTFVDQGDDYNPNLYKVTREAKTMIK